MARNQSDREDLFAEAIALVQRVEWTATSGGHSVIAGYRANGWLSIYLGPDRMYQWNEYGALRRAFVNGVLFRAQGTTLARLVRVPLDSETTLLRHDLTASELADFFVELQSAVRAFVDDDSEAYTVSRTNVPQHSAFIAPLRARLQELISQPLALAPAVAGRG